MQNRITSKHNTQLKRLASIANNILVRKELQLAAIFGMHLLEEALKYQLVRHIFCTEQDVEACQALLTQYSGADIQLYIVQQQALFRLSTIGSNSSVAALITANYNNTLPEQLNIDYLLLQQIQNTGNLGSIFRIASASGLHNIVIAKHSVDIYHPKVLQASQGIQFQLKIHTAVDFTRFLNNYHGQVLLLQPRADISIYDCNLTPATAFIVGNEGHGFATADFMDHPKIKSVFIPLDSAAESLNVSIAVALALFEMRRQRA